MVYRFYFNKRPGLLLNVQSGLLGKALIRGWALVMFSPFSATHFQKVYFPSTRQTKTEHCLPLYSEYLRFFKGGGGVFIHCRVLIIKLLWLSGWALV